MTVLPCSLNDLKAFCLSSSTVSPSFPPAAGLGLVTERLSKVSTLPVVTKLVIELTVLDSSFALTPPPFRYRIVRVVPAEGANPYACVN